MNLFLFYVYIYECAFIHLLAVVKTFDAYVSLLQCRYKKVAYLDTDVGQTEFTPPGLLSLTMMDKISPG